MNDKILNDKIKACWMGKNIGGTLGAPVEGRMEKLNLTDLPELSGKGALPNDDLDLQLINLHALENYGVKTTVVEISKEWIEHVHFPFDEYGYALTNLRRGLVPPLSGYYNNPFTDCMGSPIRSELWAAIAPGRPSVAAYFAYHDALVDHVDGEGLYGEMFLAALESLAFVNNNIDEIVEKAMVYLPENSVTARALRDTFNWFREGVPYDGIRDKILSKYNSTNFTEAPLNIAFTVVGLLYGNDFKDSLLKSVNMGYDTDCTAATLGSVLGILNGTAGIPTEWVDAVGNTIVPSSEIGGFNCPKTIDELTERTIKMEKLISLYDDECFVLNMFKNSEEQHFYLPYEVDKKDAIDILFVGEDGPVCLPGHRKTIKVEITNNTLGDWDFTLNIKGENDSYTTEHIALKSGEKTELSFALVPICKNITAHFQITFSAFYEDGLWKNFDFTACLPLASNWEVDGEQQWCRDGLIELNGVGIHRAVTDIIIPSDRNVKIACATSGPVKLWIDGNLIISSEETVAYIPAYHRGNRTRQAVVGIEKGKHRIEIETTSATDTGKIMFMPTAADKEKCYISYYHIDCEIDKQ